MTSVSIRPFAKLQLIAATFCLFSLALLAGCADNATAPLPATPSNLLAAGGASTLYAVQSGSVVAFPLTGAAANLSPSSTITAPSGVVFACVATDAAGSIYVGATITAIQQGEILVYAAGSNGAASPTRVILGGNASTTTTFSTPTSIRINSAGTLAVLSQGTYASVATFPSTASGSATPTTLLTGSSTGLSFARSLDLDNAGKIYISSEPTSTGQVSVFAANATGNAAPTSTFSLASGVAAYGVAVDPSGNIYVVADATSSATVQQFSASSTGTATPIKTLTGPSYAGGIRTDSVGNLYVINILGSGTFNFLAYSPSATATTGAAFTFASSVVTSPSAEIAVH